MDNISVLEMFGEPISIGGQESYVMTALKHMDLKNLHIDLYTPYYCDNNGYIEFMKSIGGSIYTENIPFTPGKNRRNIINLFSEFLAEHRYDVVHIHSGSTSVLAYGAMVASKAGVKKVIVHSHSSGITKDMKYYLIKMYTARFFRKYATDFCACSELAALWKFPEEIVRKKLRILKNGVDLKKFKYDENVRNKMRQQYNISPVTMIIGHVGRFAPEKNQMFLIDLMGELIKKYEDCKLVLVGAGEYIDEVKRKAKKTGVEGKIIFTGTTENIYEFMQMFDIFVFPSYYEGFGIVALEAQASGLPVVASTFVPRDIKVTNDVEFVDLEGSKEKWISSILKFKDIVREDTSAQIREKGFDIEKTSLAIRKLYFSE